jgi:hypothetical protein
MPALFAERNAIAADDDAALRVLGDRMRPRYRG